MSSAVESTRTLPDWLQNNKGIKKDCYVSIKRLNTKDEKASVTQDTADKENNTALNSNIRKNDLPSDPPPAKRYMTRRSAAIGANNENQSLPHTQQTKRAHATTQPRQPPAFIEYKGKVEYCTHFVDIAVAADTLLTWVNKQETKEMIPIAFDMEWPFTFQTGPGKTAVIQLCADIDLCYVLHVSELTKLPTTLVQLLTHDKVLLHGVNVKNDCRKLERDFTEISSQKMIDQCIDLGVYCNAVMNTGGRWSMERLVWHLLRLKINKDKKVRNSKWHIMPLSSEQQIYAAIDVYISQVMYIKLRKAEIEKEEENRKFIDEFGEEALKEKKRLL